MAVELSKIPEDILDTNNPPADHNIPALREFVAKGNARRAFLDSKISLLKLELDKLLEERNALDLEIRKHEGAISPLRHLPPEILSLIFTYAVQPCKTLKDRKNQYLLDSESGPWPLGAVCARWRRIVLFQPTLWAFLPLYYENQVADSPSVLASVSVVKVHLALSQNVPLKIVFCPSYDFFISDIEYEVLDLLAQHVPRWEEAVLSGIPALYESLSRWSLEFTMLRSLTVSVYTDEGEPELEIGNVFASCPILEEVFINHGDDAQDLSLALPAEGLRRYGANNSWEHHAEVLGTATNLVDCVLSITEPELVLVSARDKIQLPSLRRLAVTEVQFLGLLETPVLQELYCSEHTPQLHRHLRRLPGLKKLFVGSPRTPVDLASFMHSIPAVTSLCMYLPMNLASTIFEILESAPSASQGVNQLMSQADTPPLPALNALTLWFGPKMQTDLELGEPIDQEQLMRAVAAQWRATVPLGSFQMYAMKFIPLVSTLACMYTLRHQGMEFVLETRSRRLYERVVPEDFRVYRDGYSLTEILIE
ncbi:F-box domain-containing protein [Favolaschia claudopus]|uniref:F-box domain-containing protein n=1 Tax=Favolaschia claudopus TaxID=2862362 RepID=A0AAW0BFQ7_9AGAR